MDRDQNAAIRIMRSGLENLDAPISIGGGAMELKFDREENQQERLRFVRRHALRVKEVPNEVWSREQADLIDAFFENAQNFALSPSDYLRMHQARRRPEPARE